jgi:hypothetical protein
METLYLILQAIIAAMKFPAEVSKLVKLLSKSSTEKQIEINAQVDLWLSESATGGTEEEVKEPKWE